MEDINILGEYENIELTTLLRTFKKEGIENFVVVRKNKLENLIKAYKELEEKLNETLNANLALVQGNANSIPVSLIKETIEEYKKIIDKYDKQMENDEDTDLSYEEARNYMCKIESYKELLEKRK